jgi:hypothetical protein
LATDRPKRGDHRVHVAVQSVGESAAFSVALAKGRRDRTTEESFTSELLLGAIGAACGVADEPKSATLGVSGADELLDSAREVASAAMTELLLGQRKKIVMRGPPQSVADEDEDKDEPQQPPLIFPGAFNPPHQGHLRMAEDAERRLGHPLAWELSLANVDKPPLDFLTLRHRFEAIRKADPRRPVVVTRAPTFCEKAELFPGATFVVGADTLDRIADARYYGGDVERRGAVFEKLRTRGIRFLVYGRRIGDQFRTLNDLTVPASLRALCEGVPAEEFREDASSTQSRADGDRID